MFSTILISLITILIIAIYFYIKWKYYTLRGSIPGLKPEFLFGNLRQLGVIGPNRELIDTYTHGGEKMQQKFGDIFQYWIGENHFYVFCRVEHAEQIYVDRSRFDRAEMRLRTFGLIAENFIISLIGPKYKRHAKVILPMLKKNKFLSQIPIIINCVDQLIHVWKIRYENKDDIICTCLVNDNQHLMLDTFILLTFDYDLGNLKYLAKEATRFNPNEKYEPSDFSLALTIWLDALKRITMNGMPYIVNYYLLKFDRKYQNALKQLENQVEKIISKYQIEMNPTDKPTNLVASLVSSLQKDETLERTKNEIERIGLILAGYDTTATILVWFMYYVKTMRIAPIGIGSLRTVTDNVTIDGVNICKGETVVSAFALMQRDPRYWKLDPKQFIPERFFGNDAPDANHHPLVFAPFGGGHRVCAGQELARLELKLIIIRFMLFVTFVDAPGNNGGYRQRSIVAPKEVAVYIKFN
ncbi:unnamed protein product [Rotaria sordida]|uniref:Cytochrome P450 n=1 Tax=Rotaria sordida TaxID=392033 RepID=A0A819IEW2_9BILA|nr:unnamed protein product [Rotaria sordida]